jgi:aryl-alcohol dehydrogenase-like predicted oxidoreductase
MQYRQLGKTGLTVSVVGIGTAQFGGEWGKVFRQDEVDAMLGRARELGVNLIDTAECYGDHLSESHIGAAVEGHREDWVVATKFGHRWCGHLDREPHWSPDEVARQLDASLEALRTDYIDIYQFHSGPDEAFFDDALWDELRRQKEKGKIRHLGLSTGGGERGAGQVQAAPERDIEVVQVHYNRLNRQAEDRVLPLCRKHGLGVLTRVPLASGFLTGKYRPGDEDSFEEGDIRAIFGEENIHSQLEEVQRIERDEVPEGVEMAAWALAWCLQHPAVTSVIPGCKNVSQVEMNARAADLDMVRRDHPQAL